MKMFFSKKVVIGSLATTMLLGAFGAGAYADSALKKIQAWQNANIDITVDGEEINLKNDEGNMMYPLVYNGNTYVSARAISEALGAEVKWDPDSETVLVSTTGFEDEDTSGSVPTGDNSNSSSSSNSGSSSSNSSSAKGTLSDPVKFNTSFTFNDKYDYNPSDNDNYSATHTITVKKAESISYDEIEDLGFKRPDASNQTEYKMVTINIKTTNAKLTSDNGSGYYYLSMIEPQLWGTMSTDGDLKIIGGTDYGFDGSLSRAKDDEIQGVKVTMGQTKSYEVTGKILMPVLKGQESLMVFKKQAQGIEYEDSFIYFKLK